MENLEYIKENINSIKHNIDNAAKKSNRNSSDILLLAVTKTVNVDKMKFAAECGLNYFGENKVQELVKKYENLGTDYNWHMIGHLQTNKIKYIIDKIQLIHSVDSEKLAIEIDKEAKKINKVVNILLEVNVSGEETKFGIYPQNIFKVLDNISTLSNINIKGLMTVAPFVDNKEDNRTIFSKLSKLFIDIRAKQTDNIDMQYLSMGMTNDYETAIEEGANIVRIGTGIFGDRNYKL